MTDETKINILDYVKKCQSKAPRITIYGIPGIGKSTLASTFPKPLFILTEESAVKDIDYLGVLTKWDQVIKVLDSLLNVKELPFKTIVLDSISKLDNLVLNEILASEPKPKSGKPVSINSAGGGYGAGFQIAQQMHRQVKNLFDCFQSRGIAVVFIGHLTVNKYKAPDMEDYDRYSIAMNHDKSREIYIHDVDCVLFCKLKSYVTENDSGRHVVNNTGERVILTGISDVHISKNRYNMPEEIGMSFDEIKKHIPFYNEFNDNDEE